MLKRIFFLFLLFPASSQALPIDWHGTFGVDTTLINNYNRLEESSDRSHEQRAGEGGTQEIPLDTSGQPNASWQSYLFKLSPLIIINDSATIKGEISSGYARGGLLGDGMTQSLTPGVGNALYPHNFSPGNSHLTLNKLFMKLYANTATYKIGRHDSHFGLGAVVNAGEKNWDRFSSVRDGITLDVRLGNFFVAPYWAQISSSGPLSGNSNIKEYGVQLSYKNIARDLSFGLLYNEKTNAKSHSLMKSGIRNKCMKDEKDEKVEDGEVDYHECSTDDKVFPEEKLFPIKGAEVTVTDLYFLKKFNDFQLALEIPLVSGSLGNLFSDKGNASYNARAIILESLYQFSPKWSLHLNAGHVTGDSGRGGFKAMYLNPNYHIANLLFRYNLSAVANRKRNLYDSYLTNVRYLKLAGEHTSHKWTWDWAIIKAWALETAQAGKRSFNHLTNKRFDAIQSQSDDLGLEFDVNFEYRWNSAVSINGAFGYLFTGDYWKFTNDSSIVNTTKNTYALQLQTAINF